jgi:hypothetical protein
LEIRPVVFGGLGLFAAVDLKVVDDVEWQRALSVRGGFEIACIPHEGHPPRGNVVRLPLD